MNTKTSILLAPLALAMLAPAPAQSSPLISVGDKVDIYTNSSATARWQSNLFRDEKDEEDEFVVVLSPGLEINFGRGVSNMDLTIFTSYDIIRYDQFDELDTETFNFDLAGSYRGARLDVDVTAFYDEEQTTGAEESIKDDDFDDLIEFTEVGGSVFGEYVLTPKFSVKSGFRYREKSYDSYEDRFSDRDTFTIPVDVFYEMTPKFDLSVGYQYSKIDVDDRTGIKTDFKTGISELSKIEGYDYESHFINAGVRGEILPKLTGFFKVGYRQRGSYSYNIIDLEGPPFTPPEKVSEDSEGSLGLDADLTWQTTPKLTTRVGLSRDFGVGGEGDVTENTEIDVNLAYAISDYLSAGGFFLYRMREFQGFADREDDEIEAGLSLSYRPNNYWTFSGGYFYYENDSDADGYSYEDNIFSLSANFRY